jgi:hypothetical protein
MFTHKQNCDVVLVITTVGSSLLAVHLGYHADPFKVSGDTGGSADASEYPRERLE